MKVLMITGSRGWTDAASIFDVLSDYRTDEWVVIHGGAKGADKLAGQIAENMGFEVQVYLADWVERQGRGLHPQHPDGQGRRPVPGFLGRGEPGHQARDRRVQAARGPDARQADPRAPRCTCP